MMLLSETLFRLLNLACRMLGLLVLNGVGLPFVNAGTAGGRGESRKFSCGKVGLASLPHREMPLRPEEHHEDYLYLSNWRFKC